MSTGNHIFSPAIILFLSWWFHVFRGLYLVYVFDFISNLNSQGWRNFFFYLCGRRKRQHQGHKNCQNIYFPQSFQLFITFIGRRRWKVFVVFFFTSFRIPFASDVFKFMCFSGILNVRFTIEGFPLIFLLHKLMARVELKNTQIKCFPCNHKRFSSWTFYWAIIQNRENWKGSGRSNNTNRWGGKKLSSLSFKFFSWLP